MSVDQEKIALYLQGTFSQENPNQQQKDTMLKAAEDIGSSGFGTVIMGQWHVHDDGGIFYNDSALDTVSWAMENIPKALKANGNVKKVLLTFGPFATDFQGIKDNFSNFKSTIANLQTTSEFDGLDWDLEQDYDQFQSLLFDLTVWGYGLGLTVTAAPYQDNDFWKHLLKQTNAGGSKKTFAWWNLQLYGGADYPDWVGYIKNLVPDPESFLVPGYSAVQGATPSDVQNELSQLKASYPSLDGGFIWKYEAFAENGHTAKEYANAIAAGLGGGKSSATN